MCLSGKWMPLINSIHLFPFFFLLFLLSGCLQDDAFVKPDIQEEIFDPRYKVVVDCDEQDFVPEREYAKDVVLDEGRCGENVRWTLYQSGLLDITGTGRCYDYIKGALENYSREYIEQSVAKGQWPPYYGFRSDGNYDVENQQWVAPWYRYRAETDFENYMPRSLYDKFNPNGWSYSCIRIDPRITYLGDWMLYRCTVKTLLIPEGVEELGIWCIRFSPTLQKISLPSTLKKIGDYGISRNTQLTGLKIPSCVTEVGEYAFTQNSSLIAVSIPSSVKSAGKNLFEGCDNLEVCDLGGLDSIPERCFVYTTCLQKVNLPEPVQKIDDYGFAYCSSLTRIYIPKNVRTIGRLAFYGCEKLDTVFLASPYIAKQIVYPYDCGFLLNNAKVVYVPDGQFYPGAYIRKLRRGFSDKKGWNMYIKE